MAGGHIVHNLPTWNGAQNLDGAPQNTPGGALVPGTTAVENALNGFTTAANAGDQPLDTQHQLDWQNRQAKYEDAQNKFAANEENAAQQMQGVEQQSNDQMAQMLPQLMSGLTSSLGGLVGGLVSPLSQMPQQLMQAATQALQQGLSAAQSASTDGLTDEQLLGDEGLTDPLAEDLGAPGGSDAGSPGGSDVGTTPTALTAPVTGTTFPSSATPLKAGVATTTSVPTTSTMGGMTGMPMVPPGAMAGNNQQKDEKPDTKRVVAPSVKNGAPVQGRLTTPAAPPVTKLVEGKPVATRRVKTKDDGAKTEESKST